MGTDSVSRLNNSAMSLASLQDSRLSTVNFLLSNRSLDELIADRNRVLKAIDLAINARLNLDPYFDPKELTDVKRDYLADRIITKIASKEIIKAVKPVCYITIPKNYFQLRYAEYFDLEDYSIRYLLALVLSEKFSFLDSVYGGKLEIFQIDNGESYRLMRRRFQKLQNSILLSESFPWLVYVDISNYYSTIKKNILVEIIKSRLSLSAENYFLQLVEKYFEKISIGSWCDNFIQNIYLSNLDLALNSTEWSYMRMNDDIRVFCDSHQAAELAFQTIENELKKLDLEINKAKQFVIEPMINKSTSKWGYYETRCYDYTNGRTSPIIELSRVEEYPVENVYILTSDSDRQECVGIKYNLNFQKNLSYRDEILNKIGFAIQGVDIRDIIENFESRESLSAVELNILSDIFLFTTTSYQFTTRLVRLFVSKSFSSLHEEGVAGVVESVFNKFSWLSPHPDFANYSHCPTYLDYVFLRVVFLEDAPEIYDFKNIKESIWDWFKRVIYRLNERFAQDDVFLRTIRFIIEKNRLQRVDNYFSELLENELFWTEIIEENFLAKGLLGLKSIDAYRIVQHRKYKISSIELLSDCFIGSLKINLLKLHYYYFNEDYRAVIDVFKNINVEELDSIHLMLFANSFYNLGDCESAIVLYSRVLNLEENPIAYNNRGVIFRKQNRISEAILDFSSAIVLKEKALYHENRAMCYLNDGNPEGALFDFDRAIDLTPNFYNNCKFEELDFVPCRFSNSPDFNTIEKVQTEIFLKRAKLKKSLGDVSGALADLEYYCKLKKYGDSTMIRLTKELMEDKL
jgi:tetratricopeptide (TPR) repeat protein